MPFELQLLHASDFEAGIPALNDAVNFSTVINALRDDYTNTVLLTSGDNYLPGPFFSASSDPALASVLGVPAVGRADIAILNEIGFQASAFGNHEFDLGTNTISDLIGRTGAYPGTLFPYLSANLDFSRDVLNRFVVPNGQAPRPNTIAESVVLTVNGERIGVVGATTPTLPEISSPGPNVGVTPRPFAGTPTAAQLDALAAEIQTSVNALTAAGVNKVVLLAHMQQINIEQQLATRLRDVDIIMAGGSNTRLLDATDVLRPGDTAQGPYPILSTSASGQPIAIINTDGNFKYVGRLVATFDDSGVLIPSSIDPTVSGAFATDAANTARIVATNTAAGGVTATPDPEVVAITNALRNVIIAKDSTIFGQSSVFLNGTRNDVRTQETNLGNLTADANLFVAKQVDPTTVLSLKNGGGIRDNIGAIQAAPGATDPNDIVKLPTPANPLAGKEEGELSQLDVENSLRFNNALSLVTLTAAQLKDVMEHAVSPVRAGATPGGFPQIGGFEFSFDASRTARTAIGTGDRIRSLAVKDASGAITDVVVADGEVIGDPNRTFRMVTLNFLAGGGDGYPFTAYTSTLNRVDLLQPETAPRTGLAQFAANGSEQDAFAEYLAATGTFTQQDTPATQDTRIQNLAVRSDAVLSGGITGTTGSENLFGTNGNDLILGLAGDDALFGNEGKNTILGGDGNDRLYGGSGDDSLIGGNGDDELFGNEGVNALFGGAGNDKIYGGSQRDVINAGAGDDLIFANGGNNEILAGAGNDTIYTGSGDDLINGGAGNDTLWLGGGQDTIVLASGSGVDTINNFQLGQTRIGLAGGLTFGSLSLVQESGATLIEITATGEDLARLSWVQASNIASNTFITV